MTRQPPVSTRTDTLCPYPTHFRSQGERAQLVLSRDPGKPLIEAIAIAGKTVLGGIDPAGVVTVGTRDLKQGWTIFFDNPRKRPFESFPLTLARSDIDVRAAGRSE